ncbi:Polynucleotidyl transferase, putative isoform 1 [Theobroma cacao]|uniref:Polynucleotidyl transferase, putative isoform 1 n=1 Tax=Theobroma cacao TaxID=3641 RepID=A0A061FXB6_THECC|nr:Polynucleotidyl transferase, putative isoform 1 [Theobroma cacao]
MGPTTSGDRSEICFFDLETTVPKRRGQGYAILEFGAILVCSKRLLELESYSTLVRPDNLASISPSSERCNRITREDVASAPSFSEISDKVHDLLHGRVWAGHNIVRFDCLRIREAFEKIGRPAPEPKGIIDSLALLTKTFGRRAGNMKMATLANYFNIGEQRHRSLDDIRMNLEVLKYCATVLFLESSLPDILTADSVVSPRPTTRSISNSKSSPEGPSPNMQAPSSSIYESVPNLSPTDIENGEPHPIISLLTCHIGEEIPSLDASDSAQPDPFDMSRLSNEIKTEAYQLDVTMEEKPEPESPEVSLATAVAGGCSGYAGFLEPDEVSVTSISASLTPYYRGTDRIKLLHEDVVLQLFCSRLRVRFGISKKFVDQAGRPRLSIMVNVSPSLCRVLDACDAVAKKRFEDCGSSSEWRPVVNRKDGYVNYPTVRLHIPTVVSGDIVQYATEIHQKDSSGTVQKLVFSKFDAAELDNLFRTGIFVDAFFSLDPYDYQQSAASLIRKERQRKAKDHLLNKCN